MFIWFVNRTCVMGIHSGGKKRKEKHRRKVVDYLSGDSRETIPRCPDLYNSGWRRGDRRGRSQECIIYGINLSLFHRPNRCAPVYSRLRVFQVLICNRTTLLHIRHAQKHNSSRYIKNPTALTVAGHPPSTFRQWNHLFVYIVNFYTAIESRIGFTI